MAIVNTTPDSFYGSSRVAERDLLSVCEQHLVNGAKILDIGGYSTKPGATKVSVDEELARTEDAVSLVKKNFPSAIVSIDTFRQKVAQRCVSLGADVVNDVSGGGDEKMFPWVMEKKIPYVLMHMRGTPKTMSSLCSYDNVVLDVISELSKKVALLKSAGVEVVVDPGFGFAKTLPQNYQLLQSLEKFKELGCPVLVGVSRKSMVHKLLDLSPDDALNGTSVLNTVALLNGASILRVHDSLEAMQCIKIIKQLNAS